MKNFAKLLFVIAIEIINICCVNFAYEYIYPVAFLIHNNEKYIYLIHQTSVDHLDLLIWNPFTKEAQKTLLSRFKPAGLKIIPGDKGFSFINQDTLYVKMHHKRSPRLVDFNEFLYDVTLVSWIDESIFYFSACNKGMFGIYQGSLEGHCDCLIASNKYDCLYPQKVNDTLFYIERDKEFIHKIIRIHYPTPLLYQEKDSDKYIYYQRATESVRKKYSDFPKFILADLGKKNITFLSMINESEGFFLEHPAIVTSNDKSITFFYHYIHRTNDVIWQDRVLFNFTVPAYYLLHNNNDYIYESIVPFLPCYISNYGFLFFDTYEDGMNLGLKFYSTAQNKVFSFNVRKNQSLFGILIDDDGVIYYGGVVTQSGMLQPCVWESDNGILCVDLPWLAKADLFFT